jgi:DNA-binding MarR family transcriptional regulator
MATDELPPTHLAAWRAFLEAHARTVDVLERELRDEEGLNLAEYDVLVHLSEAEGGRLRMRDLAERVLLSRGGLTRLVDRMQAQGLVCRARCTSDGRGLYAELTPEGRERLRATFPTHLRGVAEHFGTHLDADEAAVLSRVLGRIADAGRPPSDPAVPGDDGRRDVRSVDAGA